MEQGVVGGRYRLVAPLGRGGSSTVWRAEDTLLGRAVALKEVRVPPSVDDALRAELHARALREARAAARIDHPAAVRVYDVVSDPDDPGAPPFVVMELLPGRTLADVIAEDGPLSPGRTAQLGRELLGALRAAHAVDTLHRDVKPANVVLRPDGSAVLTDFGIAVTADEAPLTATGLVLGSPAFVAPERVRGDEPGPPADLYGLGATLYTAVEGQPPHTGPDDMAVVTAVVDDPPIPPERAGALAPILLALLAKDPAARPDAAELDRRLAAVAGAPAGRPQPRVDRSRPADPHTLALPVHGREPMTGARSRRLPLTLAVLAATLVALVGALVVVRPDSAGPTAGSAPGSATTAATPTAATPSAAVPAAATPTAGSTTAPTGAGALPAGWVRATAPAGWSVAHPPGWTPRPVQTRASGVLTYFDDSRSSAHLLVDLTEEPAGAPAEHWQAVERDFAADHPSYERIRITKVDTAEGPAADWEFTYMEGGSLLHVLDRAVQTQQGSWALLLQAPQDNWAQVRPMFEPFTASFRPPGGDAR